LKVTVLDPCDVPKFSPLTVTAVPIEADGGETPFNTGAPLKETPLLAKPATVTTT
jgi:hypothetical protein